MMHEPPQEGPNAGRATSPQQLDLMLDEYYDLHGWDVETGRPTADVLAELGIEDLCSDLEE
jgi:aldehyde:ferredoxin oxidoreductase